MTAIDETTDHPDDPFRPRIRTQADLEQVWRFLMEPLGFSRHSIWLMLIEPDDRPMRQLTEIEDSVAPPTGELLDGLADVLGHIAGGQPGSRWAFLRSRPGSERLTDDDRAWALAMHEACRMAAVPCDVVHLATDRGITPIPLDEIGPRLAAVG